MKNSDLELYTDYLLSTFGAATGEGVKAKRIEFTDSIRAFVRTTVPKKSLNVLFDPMFPESPPL